MTPLCKWPIDHLILRVILGRGILGARGFFSCCWLRNSGGAAIGWRAGKKPSGHGSYEPHFHVILKQDSWPNRFFVGSVCFRNLICLHVGQWCVKRARNVVKLRNDEFREQCFHNSGEKIDVCTSSPDRGFAANNRKKTLAPRVGSGLRQIELNGTVLWEHYNNNNNNIHLYSAFLLVTQSALQLVNT